MKKISFFKSALAVSFSVFALALTGCEESNPDDQTPGDDDSTVVDDGKYEVGDPYIVDGKTVGIVYEVDETGEHGKAFSLTVYNLGDKFLCLKEGEQKYMVPHLEIGPYWAAIPIEEDAVPESTTDGEANCEKMKNETNWETTMLALKWVEDLAAEQKADWYIPAIDELKALVEYMSGAKFKELTMGEGESATAYVGMDPADAQTIQTSWNTIRELYKTYAPDDQYIVFQTATETELVDSKVNPEDLYKTPNDMSASQWLSSTVTNGMVQVVCLEGGLYNSDSICPEVWDNTVSASVATQAIDYEADVTSIHPICKF